MTIGRLNHEKFESSFYIAPSPIFYPKPNERSTACWYLLIDFICSSSGSERKKDSAGGILADNRPGAIQIRLCLILKRVPFAQPTFRFTKSCLKGNKHRAGCGKVSPAKLNSAFATSIESDARAKKIPSSVFLFIFRLSQIKVWAFLPEKRAKDPKRAVDWKLGAAGPLRVARK